MKRSSYLQVVGSPDRGALCYHALLGNLFLLNPAYLATLDSFCESRTPNPTESKSEMVRDLVEAGFLEENDSSRAILAERNRKWLEQISGGGQLRLLNLIVSEACNFGCRHCLHRCSTRLSQTHGQKKLMDWETARTAIDKYAAIMREHQQHPLNISFGSAEPLLNWSVVEQAVRYTRGLDPDALFGINTNLSLLTREMAEFVRDHHVYISTSLDGPPEGNDAIRTHHDGSGTYTDVMRAFDLLAEVGYPVDGFSLTLNNLNFDLVQPDFIDWATKQGFRGIATDIDLINMQDADRPVEECVEKLVSLRRACTRNGLENFGSWTTAYHTLVNGAKDCMPTFCRAVKGQNVSVNPEGQLFVCGHTTTLLGHMDEFEAAFDAGSPYEQLVRQRLPGDDLMCHGCSIEGVCAGQCHITREVARNSGNSRDLYLCEFYRLATRRLLEVKLVEELELEGKGGI